MESCGICLESFSIENIVKPCKGSDKHIFCKTCIEDWITTFNQDNIEISDVNNYNYLEENNRNCPSCPVCRSIINILNNNLQIYDDKENIISVSEYVTSTNSNNFFVKKYYKSKQIKYEFYMAPFSIKKQLYYSQTLLKNNDHFNSDFSLNIFNKPFIILNGLFIEYYENGNIKIRKNMKDNYLTGLYESFYEDATPEIVCNYYENKLHGNYISYHLNGMIHIKTQFDDNNIFGNYESYYDDGSLNTKAFFVIDLNRKNMNNADPITYLNIIGSNEHSFLDNVYIRYSKRNFTKSYQSALESTYFLSFFIVFKNTKIIKKYAYDFSLLVQKLYLSLSVELNQTNNLYTKYLYDYDNNLIKNYSYYIENDKEIIDNICISYDIKKKVVLKKTIKKYQNNKILEEKVYDTNDELISLNVFNYTKMIVYVKKYKKNILIHSYYSKLKNIFDCSYIYTPDFTNIEKKYNDNGILKCIKYYYSNFKVIKNYVENSNKAFLSNIEYISNDYSKKITYYPYSNIIEKEELIIKQRAVYEKNYYQNTNKKYIIKFDYINEYTEDCDINVHNEVKMKHIYEYDENNNFLNIKYELNNNKICLHKNNVNYILNNNYKIFDEGFKKKDVFTKVQFKNNMLHGKYKIISRNRTLVFNKYKNNKLHGMCKAFSYNDNKKIIKLMVMYNNGLKNGISKSYFDDGKIHIKSYYKNNLLHGKYIEYNTSNNLLKEEYYENNMLHGVSKKYNHHGVYISNYVYGKLHGKCEFIGNNNIIETKYFEHNMPIGIHTIFDNLNNRTLVQCNYDISEEEIGKFIDIDTIDNKNYIYGICIKYDYTFENESIILKTEYLFLIDKNKINNNLEEMSKYNYSDMYIHGLVNIINIVNNTIIAEFNFDKNTLCNTFDIYHRNGNKYISTFIENNKVTKYFDYYEENNNKLLSFNDENDLIELNKYIQLERYEFFGSTINEYSIVQLLTKSLVPFETYSSEYHIIYHDYDYHPQDDDYDDYDNYSNDSYGYDGYD